MTRPGGDFHCAVWPKAMMPPLAFFVLYNPHQGKGATDG